MKATLAALFTLAISIVYSQDIIINKTNALNNSCSDGMLSLQLQYPNNAQVPLEYQWSTGESSISINNLTEGLYHVTVTDASCARAFLSEFIYCNCAKYKFDNIISSQEVKDESCEEKGSISLTIDYKFPANIPVKLFRLEGNNEVFIEEITNRNILFSNLSHGNFRVKLYLDDCVLTNEFAINPDENLPIFTTNVENASSLFATDGLITINHNEPLNFAWSHDSNNNENFATNLAPGQYCVSVSNQTCELVECVEVSIDNQNNNSIEVIETNVIPNCKSTAPFDGYANAFMPGGIAPFQYQWSSGETSSFIENKKDGAYSVTITDAHGITNVANLYIPLINSCLIGEKSVVNASCGASNGSINLGIAGPHFYTWFNLDNNPDQVISTERNLSNIDPGNYMVRIFDATNGDFIIELQYTIGILPMELEIEHSDVTTDLGGIISPLVEGGQKPYTYEWTGPSINADNLNDEFLFDVLPGDYCVTVTDYNNCSIEDCVEINDVCYVPGNVIIEPTCEGLSIGEISFEHIQQTSIYSYELYGNNFYETNTEPIFNNLSIDIYTLVIIDQINNCSRTITGIEMTDDYYGIEEEYTDICRNSPGSIHISVNNTNSYNIVWNTGETGNSISVNEADTYFYTISNDNNSCSYSNDITINEVDYTITTQTFEAYAYTCVDNETFAIVRYLAENTGAVYQYETVPVNEQYCLRNGTDDCFDEKCFTIEYEELSFRETDGEYDCVDNTSPYLLYTPEVLGGTGSYSFEWNTGETTEEIIIELDKNYELTVTDDLGCSINMVFDNLITTPPLNVELPIDQIEIDNNGNLVAVNSVLTGIGKSPHIYLWDDGGNEDKKITTLFTEHCISVTDQCSNHFTEACLDLTLGNTSAVIYESDLLKFPAECTGTTGEVKIRTYWGWWLLVGYDSEIVTLHWPNSSGTNSSSTTLEMFYKEGKRTKFRILEGEKKYKLKSEDLNKQLAFILVNQNNQILDIFTYFPKASFFYSGLTYHPAENNSETSNDTYLGYLRNCESCEHIPPPYSTLPNCTNNSLFSTNPSEYESFTFSAYNCDNPCAGGILKIKDTNGNMIKIDFDQQGIHYPNAPQEFAHLIKYDQLPGCLWQNVNLELGIEGQINVYASLVNATIDCLCPDDAVETIEIWGTEWEQNQNGNGNNLIGCNTSYSCISYPNDIEHSLINPFIFRAQAEGNQFAEDEYFLIKTCFPCEDKPFTEWDFLENPPVSYFAKNPDHAIILEEYEELPCNINIGNESPSNHNIVSRNNDHLSIINIYPNPFDDKLNINSRVIINNIKLYNSNGLLLLDKNHTSNFITINLSIYPAGVYFIEINNVHNEKIIKL